MSNVDTPGTYIAEITDGGLGETKNGYPQFVGRFKAVKKYVEELSELKHFHEQGVVEARDDEGKTFDPQWVDWSDFDESITGFLVLFNDADSFDEDSKLLNYDQLQAATGWDGTEFESLNDGSFVGKQVLIRVTEDDYTGQTRLKVDWIDDPNANPDRELKKLDDSKVKSLQSKLKMGGKKKAAKGKPAKPSKGKGGGETRSAKTDDSATDSGESSGESSSEAPKKASPPSKKSKPAEQPEEKPKEQTSEFSLPTEVDQGEAWEFVCNNKGDNYDSAIEEAWIAGCEEVGPDKDEYDFTKKDWAKVRDIVVRDLALDV